MAKDPWHQPEIVIKDGDVSIGIGSIEVRGDPPTLGGSVGLLNPDLHRPWKVVPIYVDGREVMALHIDAARRFVRALAGEIER